MDKPLKKRAFSQVGLIDLLACDEFYVEYKNMNSDPCIYRVISIEWGKKRLSVSNGVVRRFPNFDEVKMCISTNDGFSENGKLKCPKPGTDDIMYFV